MSGINGDKARYHRLRKQKIQRRMRNRVMFGNIEQTQSSGSAAKPATKARSPRNDGAHE